MTGAIERIKDDTSIPKEIIETLDMTPKTELRPIAFTRWARHCVDELRRVGLDDDVIKAVVRVTSKKNGWSIPQTNAALRDNGLIGK